MNLPKPLVPVLSPCEPNFALTVALATSEEPPEVWGFAEFRRCRTFDEVKALAFARRLSARNEWGRIILTRGEI